MLDRTEPLSDAIMRLEYVVQRCGWAAIGRSYFDKAAYRAAAELLVCTEQAAKCRIKGALRRGSAQAYADWMAGLSPVVGGPLPANAFRHVYFARAVRQPHVIKIGITSDLDRRMGELRRETGEPHEVFKHFTGTVADEALTHRYHEPHHISREWFFDPDAACRDFPTWLPMGPAQMRILVAEAEHGHA